MLWVTGTNDFAYPMDSLQKSYRLTQGPHTLCIRVRMPHGHGGPGENPAEILAFADEPACSEGSRLAKITGQGRNGDQVWAAFRGGLADPTGRTELHLPDRPMAGPQVGNRCRRDRRCPPTRRRPDCRKGSRSIT